MTKEEYWKRLEDQDFVAIYYEYWNEHKPRDYADLVLTEFRELWDIFITAAHGRGVHTPSGIKGIDADRIRQKVFNYYSVKFDNYAK